MVYTLRIFFFKIQFFHNSNVIGSRIIQDLYIACAKIKKNNNSGTKMLIDSKRTPVQHAFLTTYMNQHERDI